MSNQETIEIDPDELSKDVVDELVENDIMDEQQAKDIGEEVWLDEMADGNPDKSSSLEYLGSLLSWNFDLVKKFGIFLKNKSVSFGNGTKNYIYNKTEIVNKRTVFADVVSVKPVKKDQTDEFGNRNKEENKVVIKLEHNEIDTFEVKIKPKSSELSNIMAYKSVDNPRELEGEKLLLARESFGPSRYNNPSILIPHNVSTSGKIRFKLYSMSREVFKKTRVHSFYQDPADDILFAYMVSGAISLLLFAATSGPIFAVLGAIPAIIWISVIGFHVNHFIFSIINGIIAIILKSDYKKIEKQN